MSKIDRCDAIGSVLNIFEDKKSISNRIINDITKPRIYVDWNDVSELGSLFLAKHTLFMTLG